MTNRELRALHDAYGKHEQVLVATVTWGVREQPIYACPCGGMFWCVRGDNHTNRIHVGPYDLNLCYECLAMTYEVLPYKHKRQFRSYLKRLGFKGRLPRTAQKHMDLLI